jgi:hypothetical protein
MTKPSSHQGRQRFDDAILAARREKAIPYGFVLDELASLSPQTRPMFGCIAVYIEDKIVLILRDKGKSPADNGIWLATAVEHHDSLRHEFPRMRSIRLFGKEPTQWQVLPADDPDFDAAAMRACKLILVGDARIGKVPKSRSSRARVPLERPRGVRRAKRVR